MEEEDMKKKKKKKSMEAMLQEEMEQDLEQKIQGEVNAKILEQLGYSFKPTDAELIHGYLMKKLRNQPLPFYCFHHLINFYHYTPSFLAEKLTSWDRTCWYFFTPSRKGGNSGVLKRRVGDEGYWKPMKRDAPIYTKDDLSKRIGAMKTLYFFQGKPGTKTDWVMQEYRVNKLTIREPNMKLDHLVLCRMYRRRRRKKESQSGLVGTTLMGTSNTPGECSTSNQSPSRMYPRETMKIDDLVRTQKGKGIDDSSHLPNSAADKQPMATSGHFFGTAPMGTSNTPGECSTSNQSLSKTITNEYPSRETMKIDDLVRTQKRKAPDDLSRLPNSATDI